jgi:integrase
MGKAYETMPRRPFDDDELQALLAAAAALDAERAARMAAETTIESGTKSKAWNERARPLYVPQAPFLRTLAATGARFAELAATTWGDWSETLRTLTLRAETTKSKKSRRIPLLKSAEEDLRALRELHRTGYGRAPKPHEPIFLTPTGFPLLTGYRHLKRFFADAMERAGLDAVSQRRGRLCIHSLRHTFASRLARANAGLTQAQMLLGHSTPELTAVVYTHHDDADLRAAVEKIQAR